MLNQFANDRDGKSAIDQLLLEFLPNPVQENLKNIVCWMSYYQFLLIYVPPYQTWFSISICFVILSFNLSALAGNCYPICVKL